MIGDNTDAVWGVMDIYPRTNFPDIRKKATLHSNSGNLLVSISYHSCIHLPDSLGIRSRDFIYLGLSFRADTISQAFTKTSTAN
jgi:hypothetical protein